MNRRQFTASLGALSGAAALPASALATTPAALSPVPAATYSWAKLIVRAQSKADPAMLSRHLGLAPDAAHNLFQTLVRDGVLRATSAAGIAQAAHPMQAHSQTIRPTQTVQREIKRAWKYFTDKDEPLVNQQGPALGCGNTNTKDHPDACTVQSIQESTQTG